MIKDQWYLACFLNELKNTNIIKRKIVGEEIVVFKNSDGDITVLEDRRCHRNVHLSNGTVEGKNIKCGYHGWEYNTSGKCAYIPMLEDKNKIPKTACVVKYPTQIKYQAVWVYFGNPILMQEAEIRATEVMSKHRSYLDTIAERLVKEETLEKDQFDEIVKDIVPAEKKKTPEFLDLPEEVTGA